MNHDRVIRLTERRATVRRVPRVDVDDLLRHHTRRIDVIPTLDRGWYRLTPRGVVGSFRTSTCRWEVRPKLGWESVRYLLGTDNSDSAADTTPDLVSAYAARLADLMLERAAAGLVHGYQEQDTLAGTIRGRLDLPRQIRDAGAVPGKFHLRVDELTTDVLWNQIPVAAAVNLARVPGLSPTSRVALDRALSRFADVSHRPLTHTDIDSLHLDARTVSYRPLIAWCRAILIGRAGECLWNLDHLFQSHVTHRLSSGSKMGRAVSSSAPIRWTAADGSSAPLVLIPDVTVVDAAGRPVAVWDMKWKHLGPTGPDVRDLHQVLGYAATLGVKYAGLVYPGRRYSSQIFEAASPVRVIVLTHRLTGTPSQHTRAVQRLVRAVYHPQRLLSR